MKIKIVLFAITLFITFNKVYNVLGLLTTNRPNLQPGQRAFGRNVAHDSGLNLKEGDSLLEVVKQVS